MGCNLASGSVKVISLAGVPLTDGLRAARAALPGSHRASAAAGNCPGLSPALDRESIMCWLIYGRFARSQVAGRQWCSFVVAGVLCSPRLEQLWLLSAVLEVGGPPQQTDYDTA